jgi:hypothetical protein
MMKGKWVYMHTILGFVGDIFVGDACCFERQTNKLSTSWNARPVQQLIRRLSTRLLIHRHDGSIVSKRNWALIVMSR